MVPSSETLVMHIYLLSLLGISFLFLFFNLIRDNHLILSLFIIGNSLAITSLFYFPSLGSNLNLIFAFLFSAFSIYCSFSFASRLKPLKNTHLPNTKLVRATSFSRCDITMLLFSLASFIVAIPDIRRFASYSYLTFQTGSFYLSPPIDYFLSISTLIVCFLFIYQRYVSILGFISLAIILSIKPFIFFVTGFRFPFLGSILFFCLSSILYLGIKPFNLFLSFLKSFIYLKFNRRLLKSLVSLFIFFLSIIFLFALTTHFRNTGSFSSVVSNNLIFYVLYEVASGSSFSMEKLGLSFSTSFPSNDFDSYCLLFNQIYPPFIPRSLWQFVQQFFSTDTSCQSFSTQIQTSRFQVFGEGSGTAASLFADFVHYTGPFFPVAILLFSFFIVVVSLLLERFLLAGLSSYFSRSFFICFFFYVPSLLIFWRLDIYSVFPFSSISCFAILSAPFLFHHSLNRS